MSDAPRLRVRERPAATGPDELPRDIPALLRDLYRRRGVHTAASLEKSLASLPHPDGLNGIDDAAGALATAIQSGRRILVVGDFDADGATSTALAVKGLKALGASRIDYLVPNRFEYGYGLTPELVTVARERAPDMILTVDNGMTAHEGVEAARAAGIEVVVTDHHLPASTRPPARAIVNPQVDSPAFEGRHLAGVGVCFYVLLATRSILRCRGALPADQPEPNPADHLDLVALGTVADVVPLDRVNRLLVEQGLRRIRAGRATPGVQALLDAAGRAPGRVSASDLGFGAAPRLNAAGRLDDMSLGIETLLAADPDTARERATHLENLNRERRQLERTMRDTAIADIEAEALAAAGDISPIICLFNAQWHQGVVGIVASRLKERFQRPVIAFAPGEEGALKGSARSVAGLHMRDLLEAVNTRSDGRLIERFGGHAMAAGLTLRRDHFEPFKGLLTEVARHWLGDTPDAEAIWTDGPLPAEAYTLETATMLRYAGPWGAGFPEPQFHERLQIHAPRVVGGNHLKLSVRPAGHSTDLIDAIAFNAADTIIPTAGETLEAVFRLTVNDYRGVERPQLIIEHLAPG